MTHKVKALFLQSNFLDVGFIIKDDEVLKTFYDCKNNSVKLHNIYRGKIIDKSVSMSSFFVQLDDENISLLKFHKNNQHLIIGEKVLVQIIREPLGVFNNYVQKNSQHNKLTYLNKTSLKHSLCTDDIALVGKFVIHKPFSKLFIIAKTMEQDRKNEIKQLPIFQNYLGILRSSYSHVKQHLAIAEAEALRQLFSQIQRQNVDKIGILYCDNLWHRAYVDNSNYDVEEIWYHSIENNNITLPNFTSYPNIKPHIKKNYIGDEFNLISAIDDIFTSKYNINEQIELVFNQSESFNYIDVNFKNDNFYPSKEENAYRVNMQILSQIVKMIVLKNASGQIFVDLLKLHNKNYHKNIITTINQIFLKEGVKANALGFSNLGLLEILRPKSQIAISLDLDFKFKVEILLLLLKIENVFINETPSKILVDLPAYTLDYLVNYAHDCYLKCINQYGVCFNALNNMDNNMINKISIES